MEAVGIVLNIRMERVAEFEEGFRQHELPIWDEFVGRGIMLHASLTRMEISTQPTASAVQYLISVSPTTKAITSTTEILGFGRGTTWPRIIRWPHRSWPVGRSSSVPGNRSNGRSDRSGEEANEE